MGQKILWFRKSLLPSAGLILLLISHCAVFGDNSKGSRRSGEAPLPRTGQGTPRLWGETAAGAGEAAFFWISPADGLDKVRFELRPKIPGETLPADSPPAARGVMVPWEPVPGRPVLLGTLPVPAGAEPGRYTLFLRGERGLRPWRLRGEFRVQARERGSTELSINPKMNSILHTPDPRKAEQARRLWEVLGRVSPEARYLTGTFQRPLEGDRITSPFGYLRRYIYPSGRGNSVRHHGVDFGYPSGTPVTACGAGRVVLAEDRIVSGKSVIIEHWPGVFSLYYHLNRMECAEGDRLEPGDPVGTVGTTGFSTGPHLHWEVRIFGTPVDPLALEKKPLVDKSSILSKIGIHYRKGR